MKKEEPSFCTVCKTGFTVQNKTEKTIIHLIKIYEKINFINFYVVPLVRNGMGAEFRGEGNRPQ